METDLVSGIYVEMPVHWTVSKIIILFMKMTVLWDVPLCRWYLGTITEESTAFIFHPCTFEM